MRTDDGQLCKRAYRQHRVRRVTSRALHQPASALAALRSAPPDSSGARELGRARRNDRATSSGGEEGRRERERERGREGEGGKREKERERKEKESAARARGSGSERGLEDAAQLTHRTRAH